MISVQSLTKIFPAKNNFFFKKKSETAEMLSRANSVDNISFECKPGRIFSLLGPNGAGKTTALRMISTLLKPSSGKIIVANLDVEEFPTQVRSKIGFLTGSTGLYARLTANEMVKYFADLNGLDDATFKNRKNELFTLLGVHEFANKRIGTLSTGMKQKVSIVRTMIHNPEVVVFDEPTSGLDVITAANIIELIRHCKAQNKTVIFSSHIMEEVNLLCDDLAIMHNGKILFNDTMEKFRAEHGSHSLTEAFIETVQKN